MDHSHFSDMFSVYAIRTYSKTVNELYRRGTRPIGSLSCAGMINPHCRGAERI